MVTNQTKTKTTDGIIILIPEVIWMIIAPPINELSKNAPYIFVPGIKNNKAETISPVAIINRQLLRCICSNISGCMNLPYALYKYNAVSKTAITHATIFLGLDITIVSIELKINCQFDILNNVTLNKMFIRPQHFYMFLKPCSFTDPIFV
jgi:hypothetical protein